jgi:hypothetical protein
MAADAEFAARYRLFLRDMVYGEYTEFETAVATLKSLAARLP